MVLFGEPDKANHTGFGTVMSKTWKPEIVEFYNKAKSGVDTLDETTLRQYDITVPIIHIDGALLYFIIH